ncbi:unnamed protein product [Camellia sinensis]
MELKSSTIVKLLIVLQCLSVVCFAQDFDFFYFVQQVDGQDHTVTRSKVVAIRQQGSQQQISEFMDFGPITMTALTLPIAILIALMINPRISDLISRMQDSWPTLACPSGDGSTFWSHEWDKHGTCSESVLDQHSYFKSALNLKSHIDLLQILQSADETNFGQWHRRWLTGINPDGGSYSLSSIKGAIKNAIGYTPFIECNVDSSGNSQLYQVYICVDTSGSNFIECPVLPRGKCASNLEFPSF